MRLANLEAAFQLLLCKLAQTFAFVAFYLRAAHLDILIAFLTRFCAGVWAAHDTREKFERGKPVCSIETTRATRFLIDLAGQLKRRRSSSRFFSYAFTRTVAHPTRMPVIKRRNRCAPIVRFILPRTTSYQLSGSIRFYEDSLDDPCKPALSEDPLDATDTHCKANWENFCSIL